MYLISFRCFKEYCGYITNNTWNRKDSCELGHNDWETLASEMVDGKRKVHQYNPCKEKYCPVLGGCKRIK